MIRLVPGPGYGEATESEILSRVRTSLGGATTVAIDRVGRIEPHGSGKYQMVMKAGQEQSGPS